MKFPLWPWRRHGNVPLRKQPAKVTLLVEALEDRLVPSTSPLTGQEYEAWRDLAFTVDDVAVANLTPAIDVEIPLNVETQANASFGSGINLDQAWANYSYRGTGYSVAVIDTGVDYNNPYLGGGWGNRVIAGWDFANNDGDPMDDNGHGTHVAGIIGSSSTQYSGVAPDVNLIALKVLSANGSGTFGAVEDALRWVIDHQAQYNIVAVNLSLGAGNYTINPYTFLDDEFASLMSQGVFVAAASGNSFYSYGSQQGLGYPAIIPQAVSVGAVWTADYGSVAWLSGARDLTTAPDRITSFTQRSSQLDLLAPGAMITSTYLGNTFRAMSGTSMATPVVAGAAALLHQALDATGHQNQANQDYILGLMQSTGVTLNDGDDENDNVTNTGLNFKRLDLYGALSAIKEANAAPTLNAIAGQTMNPGQPLVVGLSASDPNGDALTFSARVVGAAAPVTFSFNGQQLTINLTNSTYKGSFTVEVTASDGSLTATQSFSVTVPNVAPTLGVIGAQTLAYGQALTVTLPGSDANGDALTYTARVIGTGSSAAYDLQQRLGLRVQGSYFTNAWGQQEKWLVSRTGEWHCILPNGEVRRWTGTMAGTLGSAALVAKLDVSYYNDPNLLINAQPGAAPPVNVAVNGNTLTLQLTDPNYRGSFNVEVTVSDGAASAKQTFAVNVTAPAPTLAPIPNQTVASGQPLTVTLGAVGDNLTYAARELTSGSSAAYELDQRLGLSYAGSYYTGVFGMNEKWMVGASNVWYCILQNGEVRRWAGSMTATMSAANLMGTLDSSFYADPSLLWNAQPNSAPNLVFTFSGNRLTIQAPTGYKGSFTVEVTVSNSQGSAKQTFVVVVS